MTPQADPDEPNVSPLIPPLEPEDLPYSVLLWDLPRREVERVLARAASASLARAIFVAAQSEHLGRKITLQQGQRVIAQSE